MKKKLNIGSGADYMPGWVNLDLRDNIKADKKHDLNKFPYPFKKDEFDEVVASHILEHVDDPIKTLKELSRICKNGARIIVKVPHAFSYANATDLQHKTNFTENSFTNHHFREYEIDNLKLVKTGFEFPVNKWKKFIPFKKYLKIFFIGVYDDLYFEFEVVK